VLPNRAIAKGKLEPWQVDIGDVEQAAGIKLPLPAGIDPRNEADALAGEPWGLGEKA